ncbi:hypothetical protein QL285_033818 [Trifolium repens]|nr:hypothetical protein QL285_033818 [Trifolium repens]
MSPKHQQHTTISNNHYQHFKTSNHHHTIKTPFKPHKTTRKTVATKHGYTRSNNTHPPTKSYPIALIQIQIQILTPTNQNTKTTANSLKRILHQNQIRIPRTPNPAANPSPQTPNRRQ